MLEISLFDVITWGTILNSREQKCYLYTKVKSHIYTYERLRPVLEMVKHMEKVDQATLALLDSKI